MTLTFHEGWFMSSIAPSPASCALFISTSTIFLATAGPKMHLKATFHRYPVPAWPSQITPNLADVLLTKQRLPAIGTVVEIRLERSPDVADPTSSREGVQVGSRLSLSVAMTTSASIVMQERPFLLCSLGMFFQHKRLDGSHLFLHREANFWLEDGITAHEVLNS